MGDVSRHKRDVTARTEYQIKKTFLAADKPIVFTVHLFRFVRTAIFIVANRHRVQISSTNGSIRKFQNNRLYHFEKPYSREHGQNIFKRLSLSDDNNYELEMLT